MERAERTWTSKFERQKRMTVSGECLGSSGLHDSKIHWSDSSDKDDEQWWRVRGKYRGFPGRKE